MSKPKPLFASKPITVSLPDWLFKKFTRLAEKEFKTRPQLVADLIRDYVDDAESAGLTLC